MRRRTKVTTFIAGLLTVATTGVGLMVNSASAAIAAYPVNYSFLTGFAGHLADPGSPPGSNVPCHPTAAHPHPVVLVHGTIENQADNWQAASALFADNGYCVYSLTYGAVGPLGGLGDISASAQQLSTFVDQVLATTGASQVDIVGHSQGGMMPRYYLKFLGGAPKVHELVGIAPSNYGTTFNGVLSVVGALGLTADPHSLSILQQTQGSAFLAQLNAGGDTVPGVRYVVIETRYDEVVTPYTDAFLRDRNPAVQNITLQDVCPADLVDHLAIPYDYPTLHIALNALAEAPDPVAGVSCTGT